MSNAAERDVIIEAGAWVDRLVRRFPRGQRDDLRQVALESVLAAWRLWSVGPKETQFSAVAYRRAFFDVFDASRDEARHHVRRTETSIEELNLACSNSSDFERPCEAGRLLSELEGIDLEVVVMKHFEGLTISEISERTNRPVTDVNRILDHAMATLGDRAAVTLRAA